MRHSRIRKTVIGIGRVAAGSALAIVPLMLLLFLCRIEHDRRVVIARTGERAMATVTESVRYYKGCSFTYRFVADDRMFNGTGECSLIDRYPVGSRLAVRFDPVDPSRSMAPDAELWPGWTIIVLMFLALVLFVSGALAWDVLQDPNRAWRRRQGRRAAGGGRRS